MLQPALLEPLDDATASDAAGAVAGALADAGELLRVLATGSRGRHMRPGPGLGAQAGPDACDADREAALAERLAAGVLAVCGAAAPVVADADGSPLTVMQARSQDTCNNVELSRDTYFIALLIVYDALPQAFSEAAEDQLHTALRAALAAAGDLVSAWPAQRMPLLYAGVLLLGAAPHGELGLRLEGVE